MRARTVNVPLLVTVADAVLAEILPVVAPLGTTAVNCPSFTNVKVADVPLNVTPVVPVNPDPRIVTVAPTGPLPEERSC